MRVASIALFALPAVFAQSSTTSSASAGATHVVGVGNGGLVFNPSTVNASVGDVVKFDFYPMNHSVAQATFDAPCKPQDNGLFSGYMPVSSGTASESYEVQINNTNAIWLYCSYGSHCQEGMVMVINPVGGMSATNLDNFKTAASKATVNEGPSNNAVNGGILVQNTNSTGSSTTSSGSASSTGSSSGTATSGSSKTTATTGSMTGTATSSGSATASAGSKSAAAGLRTEKFVGDVLAAVAGGVALAAFMF